MGNYIVEKHFNVHYYVQILSDLAKTIEVYNYILYTNLYKYCSND